MSSKDTEDEINCTIARINKLKYYDNTKGNTLVTNAASELTPFPAGTNDQIMMADSTYPLGVKWFTVPTNVSIYFGTLVGAIMTYTNTRSYSLFNPHTVTLPDLSSSYCEIQFISSPQTVLKLLIYPSSNFTWPNNSNFVFDIGYMRNLAGTGPPTAFSTISATTNSFVPIVGTTLNVGNSYSNTRNPAILTVNIPILGPEYLCIRCVNNTFTSGLILTANIIMKTGV